MNETQMKFLAKKFLNLDIKFQDPEVWIEYIQIKRSFDYPYYTAALCMLWHITQQHIEESDICSFFEKEISVKPYLSELHDLLHSIEEDPTDLQVTLFHLIEMKYEEYDSS